MKKQKSATVVEQTPITVVEEVVESNEQSANGDAGIPDLTGIKFAAPKTAKGKSTRPTCDHTHNEKGTDGALVTKRCQLRVLEGEAQCVNHVPAERRLTEDEGMVLSAWIETMTPAERLVMYVRQVGWFKAKEQAKAI